MLKLLCESFGSAAAVLALRITATEQQILLMTIEALMQRTGFVGELGAKLDAQHFRLRIVAERVFVPRKRVVKRILIDDRKQRIDAESV